MESTSQMFARIVLEIKDPYDRELAILRYIMRQRDITVQDVAESMDVSLRYVYYIVSGKRRSLKALDKVDKAITVITDNRGGIGSNSYPLMKLDSISIKSLMEEQP